VIGLAILISISITGLAEQRRGRRRRTEPT
jgi:hypothetical protein